MAQTLILIAAGLNIANAWMSLEKGDDLLTITFAIIAVLLITASITYEGPHQKERE